jgi:hypothetical protein
VTEGEWLCARDQPGVNLLRQRVALTQRCRWWGTVEEPALAQILDERPWSGSVGMPRAGTSRFHRTLKSDCRIEDRLGTADSLQACLALDLAVAWRVMYLTKLGRETPDVPCSAFSIFHPSMPAGP